MKIIYFLLIMLSCLTLVYAEQPDMDAVRFNSMTNSNRYYALIKELRCVVCQGQNIADSNAPLASDLRKKVFQLITEKKTDDEIKDYLVKRYGEFILLEPRFNKLNFLLWAFPFMGLLFSLILFISFNKSA